MEMQMLRQMLLEAMIQVITDQFDEADGDFFRKQV